VPGCARVRRSRQKTWVPNRGAKGRDNAEQRAAYKCRLGRVARHGASDEQSDGGVDRGGRGLALLEGSGVLVLVSLGFVHSDWLTII